MAFQRNKDKGDIAVVAFFIAIAALALVFVIPFARPQPNVNSTKLGTWYNMPNASKCPVDVNGGDEVPDQCELMGNTSYRAVFPASSDLNIAVPVVQLGVSCVSPSNNVNAVLVLQYAYYDSVIFQNTTNFVNVGPIGFPGASVIINSTNIRGVNCPGTLWSQGFAVTPTGGTYIVFRVVGESGNGLGDNPRFTNVLVNIDSQFTKAGGTAVTSITTTMFTGVITVSYPEAANTSGTLRWIASNSTITKVFLEQGAVGCTIIAQTSSCTVSVTFSPAFKTLPQVVTTSNLNPFQLFVPVGSITLFSVEVINV